MSSENGKEDKYDLKDSCLVPMMKGVGVGSLLGFLASAIVRRPMPLVFGLGIGSGYGLKSCFPNNEEEKEAEEQDTKEERKE